MAIVTTLELWETYQKTQSNEDLLRWLKHRAWVKAMKQIEITVYNYENKYGVPYKMTINAFCVGGEEGVFAVFQIPTNPKWIGFADGDDGHWVLHKVFDKGWREGIIEALNAIGE
jgi:hypothetical protein